MLFCSHQCKSLESKHGLKRLHSGNPLKPRMVSFRAGVTDIPVPLHHRVLHPTPTAMLKVIKIRLKQVSIKISLKLSLR